MVALSAPFKKAVEESKGLTSKPTNDELLQLYALFKVGNNENFSAAAKPSMFDLKGKAKYAAWEDLVEEDVKPPQAQEKYVALVEELKNRLGFDPSKKSA